MFMACSLIWCSLLYFRRVEGRPCNFLNVYHIADGIFTRTQKWKIQAQMDERVQQVALALSQYHGTGAQPDIVINPASQRRSIPWG
jgi:hypothetical protein